MIRQIPSSIWELLVHPQTPDRAPPYQSFGCSPHGAGLAPTGILVTGPMKRIQRPPRPSVSALKERHDRAADRLEQNNMASNPQFAVLAAALRAALKEWIGRQQDEKTVFNEP